MSVDETKADAIRAAFRAARTAGIRLNTATLDNSTTEGETWTATRLQRASTVATAFRAAYSDEFIVATITPLVREDAEVMGGVALDEDPEVTWQPLNDDMTPDYHGMVRSPKWWVLTVSQPVAVPEGHPALLLDQETT